MTSASPLRTAPQPPAAPRTGPARTGSRRLAPPTGSWADDLWASWTATPQRRRRLEWTLVGIITLIAALARFVALGHPHRLVFDEVYYVLDGWTVSREGYEATYPEGGREGFAAGDVNAYDPEKPSYVVHPPFGKYLIGWGMHLFGAEHSFAWRFAVALFGTLLVPLTYLVGKKLFDSIGLAAIAAGFLAIDGHAIVTSRISILDGLIAFFVLLGFLFLLYDREQQRRQLFDWVARWRQRAHAADPSVPLESTPARWSFTIGDPKRARPTGPDWGPILWRRPWLLAMAASLALASSIKWSGAYFLAAFCLATIVFDMAARKQAGITFWMSAGILKQGWASFLLTIPLSIAIYLASWTGWFRSEHGFYRHWVEGDAARAWEGALAWVPNAFQNLWHYHAEAFRFHSNLHGDHPYISGPLEWPFLLRPTAFSYEYVNGVDDPSCIAEQCVTAITSLSNPLAYWLGTIAIVFLVMYVFVKPSWRYGAILTGWFAGWLPWLLTGRTSVYHFYVIAWLPFAFLAAAFALQTIAGSAKDDRRQRTVAVNVCCGFLVAVVLVSLWFLPTWVGIQVPTWYWNSTHWLPGWK